MRRVLRQSKRALAVVVPILVVVAGCSTSAASTQPKTRSHSEAASAPPAVPVQYRALYATLSANIADLDRQGTAGSVDPVALAGTTSLGAHLDLAAGNRGSALLERATIGDVTEELDRFEQMGMKGVMVSIAYPMLLPWFENASAYLHFYEQVAALIAARSMFMSVELNPAFSDPQLSTLHPDYRGLTISSYATGQRQEAQLIIDDLHPRYLTLLDEPSTFASVLRLPIATAPAVVSLLNQELDGLQTGTTMLGAGIGSWENPGIEKAIATQTGVNYLSVHVYPTGAQQITNLDQVTTIASTARKPLVIDETWLSKSNPNGSPLPGSAVNEQKIKDWSFWEPLDIRFLQAITDYASSHGVSFVSPFSSGLFFGYVHWSRWLQQAAKSTVSAEESRAELSNIGADHLDALGQAYEKVARQLPTLGRPSE